MLRRDWRSSLGALFAALVIAVGLAGCDSMRSLPPVDPASYLRMHVVSLSPDGRRLAFDYCRTSRCGIGILDVETDAIRLIDNPEGLEMIAPSFSDDGRKLAVALGCRCGNDEPGAYETHIVVLDLRTGGHTSLTINPSDYRAAARIYPVFVPNSENVLFVSAPVLELGGRAIRAGRPREFVIVDTRTRAERVVASLEDLDFYAIAKPTFLDADTIAFSGLIVDQATSAKFGLPKFRTSGGGELPYAAFRFRFGGAIDVHGLTRDRKLVGYISASRDSRRIVFTDYTPARKPNGPFVQLDVFMAEGGRIEQISDIAASLHDTHISLDGSRVAVINNRGRNADELYLIDVATRATRYVPLRERLLQMVPN